MDGPSHYIAGEKALSVGEAALAHAHFAAAQVAATIAANDAWADRLPDGHGPRSLVVTTPIATGDVDECGDQVYRRSQSSPWAKALANVPGADQ